MDRHRTVLGVLYLVSAALGLIGILAVLTVFTAGGAVLGMVASQEPDVPLLLPLFPVGFGIVIATIIGLTSLPNVIAGYGLLADRSWAPMVSLIVGIFNLPALPFGTAVGVYAICFFLWGAGSGVPSRHPEHPPSAPPTVLP